MTTALIPASTFLLTLLVTLALIRVAPTLKLLDYPGGRKAHIGTTPVVGGLSITFVCIIALFVLKTQSWIAMCVAISILLAIGTLDDIYDLPPTPKLLAQASAVFVMFYVANVKLLTVGNLLGTGAIGTWMLAPVITTFAVIGVINAINMADGIDGHAGFISLIGLLTYAYVAHESALPDQFAVLLTLAGAVGAFLVFNARSPWVKRAKTFLGDAGSMMLGFTLAYFAIDISQGTGRSFPPICALWVVVIPLCDCVSLMIRRKLAGGSMFAADRNHLHHYLLSFRLSVGQATMVSAVASLVCASIGVAAWKLKIPEPAIFAAFVVFFIVYHVHMTRVFGNMGQRDQKPDGEPNSESAPT